MDEVAHQRFARRTASMSHSPRKFREFIANRISARISLAVALFAAASLASAADFAVLHAFDDQRPKDATAPGGALLLAKDGSGLMYGISEGGGQTTGEDEGTIFSIDPQGNVKTLHRFASSEGILPNAPLVQTDDGSLWGTAQAGGAIGGGSIFKLQPDGKLVVMYSFGTQPGQLPRAGLMIASDGSLWGTAGYGSTSNIGEVFRIDQQGIFTIVHSFGDLPRTGAHPEGRLMQATDGSIYGTTTETSLEGATAIGGGTVFRIAPDGTYSVALEFAGDCRYGCQPQAGLIDGHDGWFYGTTEGGGRKAGGTVFRMDASGAGRHMQVLHDFKSAPALDGSFPTGDLLLASNRAIYGTTTDGGTKKTGLGPGTVFKIDASGAYSQLHVFACLQTGCLPHGALIETTPGVLIGTTQDDGVNPSKGGSVWSITDQ